MADMVITLSGDEAKLFRAQQKIINQQVELEKKYSDIGKASKKATADAKAGADDAGKATGVLGSHLDAVGEKAEKAFSADRIVNFATSVVGVGSAIALATKAFADFQAAKVAATETLDTTTLADRRLLQVADSGEDFTAMQKRADAGATKYGIDRTVARDVLFSAKSEGFTQDYEKLLEASPVIDPQSSKIAAGKLPSLFGGQIKPLEGVSLTLKAAKESNLSFEQLAGALPQASEGGAIAKSTPEETLAVLSVLAGRFKSGETAADRVKVFATAEGLDPRLAGKGIIAAFEEIQAMSEDDRKDFLGKSAELNSAYVIMGEEMEKIKGRLGQLQTERQEFAAGGGILAQQVAIVNSNDRIVANRALNAAKINEEIAKEKRFAVGGAAELANQSDVRAAADEAQLGVGTRFIANQTAPVAGKVTSAVLGRALSDDESKAAAGGFTSGLVQSTPTLQALDLLSSFVVGGGSAYGSAISGPAKEKAKPIVLQPAQQADVVTATDGLTANERMLAVASPADQTTVSPAGFDLAKQSQPKPTEPTVASGPSANDKILALLEQNKGLLEQQNAMLEKQHAENLGAKNTDRSTTKAAIQSANAQTAAKGIGAL